MGRDHGENGKAGIIKPDLCMHVYAGRLRKKNMFRSMKKPLCIVLILMTVLFVSEMREGNVPIPAISFCVVSWYE